MAESNFVDYVKIPFALRKGRKRLYAHASS